MAVSNLNSNLRNTHPVGCQADEWGTESRSPLKNAQSKKLADLETRQRRDQSAHMHSNNKKSKRNRSGSFSSSSSDSSTDENSSDNESDISDNPRFRDNLSSRNITVNSIPLPTFTIEEDIRLGCFFISFILFKNFLR